MTRDAIAAALVAASVVVAANGPTPAAAELPRPAGRPDPAGRPAPAVLAEQVRAILAGAGCQTSGPSGTPPRVEKSRAAESEARGSCPVVVWHEGSSTSSAAGDLWTPFFTVVAVLLAAAGLVFLLLLLRSRASPAAALDEGRVASGRAAPGRPAATVPPWELLAAAARFNEAVHGLLLAAFQRLASRGTLSLRPHLTSNELLGQQSLPGTVRTPLQELVAAVERSLFGGLALDAGDYARAVAHYEAIRRGIPPP